MRFEVYTVKEDSRRPFWIFLLLQFLPGSTDRNTPVTQLLGTPVSAQYLRIFAVEVNGLAGLRFEVLGCTPDCKESSSPVLQTNELS